MLQGLVHPRQRQIPFLPKGIPTWIVTTHDSDVYAIGSDLHIARYLQIEAPLQPLFS